MKTIVEFIKMHHLSDIIFDLDEKSEIVIDCDSIIKEIYGHKVIWRSSNKDTLNIGNHAMSREHRSVADGGDGSSIKESEIVNIFRYVWNDLMKMRYDGKLNKTYDIKTQREVKSFVIECQAYISAEDGKVKYNGPREESKTLWIVFLVEDKSDYKNDLYIKTIYRGEHFNHSKAQERMKIRKDGSIVQIYNSRFI